MKPAFRAALLVFAVIALAFSAGYLAGLPRGFLLWPLGATPPTRAFLGGMAAAIALPSLWIAWTRDAYALRSASIGVFVAFAPTAIYIVVALVDEAVRSRVASLAVAATLLALAAAAAFWLSRSSLPLDPRPTPRPVRLAFGLIAIVLAFAGAALILRYPVFPWSLGRHNATVFGFLFVGAMCYFLHGYLHPNWSNARGQLLALLGFDLAFGLTVARLSFRVEQDVDVGILAFSAFVAATAILAIAYLVVIAQWRLRARAADAEPA